METPPPAAVLTTLQALGLAAPLASVDHLRNIMASPTAGIDPQALIDTRQSDIALLGITLPQGDTMVEAYRVYVGTGAEPFGRPLYQTVPATDIPALLTHMLQIYQGNRSTPDGSFGAFTDRYALADLQQLFDQPSLAQSQTYV